ncbi:MAG: glycosyl hydrolase 53 family protein [Lachnospiraceae bacterium]|nr:glycosyl hydrolase 53 family protein [Lachnospiraceae bacterium]
MCRRTGWNWNRKMIAAGMGIALALSSVPAPGAMLMAMAEEDGSEDAADGGDSSDTEVIVEDGTVIVSDTEASADDGDTDAGASDEGTTSEDGASDAGTTNDGTSDDGDGTTDAGTSSDDAAGDDDGTDADTADNEAVDVILESVEDLDDAADETAETVVEVTDTVAPVDADIAVDHIDLPEDFMEGVDISSFASLIDSGVTFYDFDGNELDEAGFFDLLADCGVNYVRIRVWNDPYDSEGNSYGGGNCDVDQAIRMGQWATEAGLKVAIDFHYSDFWADPGKQFAPKAWEDMTLKEKVEALGSWTKEALTEILEAGVDVGMVQIGNETTTGMAGETDWSNMCKLFSAGSAAVREVSEAFETEILVALHFANPESGKYETFAKILAQNEVDYDVFASSYYPYWHGTLENLTETLSSIAEKYDKYVIVAETSWAYTLEDGDGSGNTVAEGNNDTAYGDLVYYDFSVQGQADEISAVISAMAETTNGIGVFYWEPAWIPVQVYDADADDAETILEENQEIWETYGSGWASSYAAEYDPDDAGVYYGGSAVDNQALFDFEGYPLESLKTFEYVKTGTTAERVIVETEAETEFLDTVENLLENGDFEDGDTAWTVTGTGGGIKDTETSNVWSGVFCLHFWSSSDFAFEAAQEVTLEPGVYTLTVYLQGGDAGDDDTFTMYVETDDGTVTVDAELTGWRNWSTPTIEDIEITETTTITVGCTVDASAGCWGAWDDFVLYKAADVE